MNTKKIAGLFATLMEKELGYARFFAHGGDWGSSITEQLALYHSELLSGIHLTDVPFAYASIQSTKPQSLTNLSIYWATQTINSSFRLYYEAIMAIMQATYNPLVKLNPFDRTGDKSEVPAAFALFPKDISQPPREYAERFFNVRRWTEMGRGGHFAALEQPELLATDIRQFAKDLYMRA